MKPPEKTGLHPLPLDNDRLWDANDVARFFAASRSWVYHQSEAGTLPCLRIGGFLRFDPSTIRAFAAGGGIQPSLPSAGVRKMRSTRNTSDGRTITVGDVSPARRAAVAGKDR